jgi:lipopolysaccharide export system permease protein
MKKLIFRKFYQDTFAFFLVSIFLMGLIVWIIQAVNYFDYVTEDGHGLKVYFFYSILNFPKIIHRILPFIFFISLFYTIINYELNNEISIFWINGVSKINFANKLLLFSIILMLFQIILGAYFSPMSKFKARLFLKNSNVDFFASLMREGKFINITKGLTIFINKKKDDGTLTDIFLEETKGNNSKMIYAKKGIIVNDLSQKTLKLFDGRVINNENSKINLFNFDQINFNLSNLNSNTITTPKIQELNIISLLSCYVDIKNNGLKDLICEKKLNKEIKRELFKRLHKPVYIPLIALFSCFLLLYSKNNKNFKTKINFLFLIIFFILIYSEVSLRYSVISTNLSIIYLLIPFFLFFLVYIFFYRMTKNV